jgi:2-polyprenyl-6-methoxyphenol hydroxylase-like FAD-dependent oxidoreductase
MLGTILARWGYRIKHIDNRAEPTPTGRADGIQPRSLDLLRNMGLKTAIMSHKPARVYEVAFWDPPKSGKGITRTGTWASCPSFIDARYPFTTLLHQGLIERAFIADLDKNGVQIQRPWTITGFTSDAEKNPEYPVEVKLEHVDGTAKETIRAKYLFGGEGAKSFVREQLKIGIKHKDPIAHVWGVMDGVVQTNFPDIKVSYAPTLADGQVVQLTDLADEMHHPLRARIHNGDSEGGQHGPAVHPDCLFDRRRLEPAEDGDGRGGAGVSQEDIPTLQHRVGVRRVVFGLSNRSRHLGQVYP